MRAGGDGKCDRRRECQGCAALDHGVPLFVSQSSSAICAWMRSNSGYCLGIASAKAAFGTDREILDVLSRGGKPLPGARQPVGVVHQTEAELGLRPQLQIPQRLEVGVIGAVARHRHMDELDRPPDPAAHAVRELDHVGHIGRLNHVLVAGVAVTEMEQQVDAARHVVAEIDQDVAERFLRLLLERP